MAPSAISTLPHNSREATQQNGQDEQTAAAQKQKKTPLQMIAQGVALPGIPQHPTFELHRQWMLGKMALAFRVFARKALGKHFALLKSSDMVLVDYSGTPIGGATHHPANAAGFQIHSALHRARPDVTAACHTHSPHGKAWSAFARPLEMLNQDVTYFHGDAQAVYAEFGGVVFTSAEGERLAAALGPRGKGMVLRNHGLLTVGATVDEACYLFTLMERSCEVQLRVEAAAANGVPKVYVPEEAARYTYEMASDPEALYWEAQPDMEYEAFMCNDAHNG